MAHRYNLRSAAKKDPLPPTPPRSAPLQQLQRAVQTHNKDQQRVTVTISATGEGQHLRWHYSEVLEPQPPATAAATAPAHLVDDDGDSVMGDSDSDSEASEYNDGDSVMGDEDDEIVRFHTPLRAEPYDAGSVILTPKKKGCALQRSPRIGGGYDWWHDKDGVRANLVYARPGEPVAGPSRRKGGELDPDTEYLRRAIEAGRKKLMLASAKSPPPELDELASDEDSDEEGTVIFDSHASVRAPPLPNNQLPYVRDPPRAAEHLQAPKPNVENKGRLSNWPPRQSDSEWHVHLYHDEHGNWVREGSVGPEVEYPVDLTLLPPKVHKDVPQVEAKPTPDSAAEDASSRVCRTDTEPVLEEDLRYPWKRELRRH